MGIFSGLGKALSGFNKAGDDGLSFANKLQIAGALAQGDTQGAAALQSMFSGRQEKAKTKEAQQALLAQLTGALGGGYEAGPSPTVSRPDPAPVPNLGQVSMGLPQAQVQAPDPYQYVAPKKLPQRTLNDPQVQSALLAASLGGLPGVSNVIGLLDKTRPEIDFVNGQAVDKRAVAPGTRVGVNLSNVNGFMVDQQDPGQVGRFYGEVPAKGSEPAYNQRGEQIGWRMADGSLQAIESAAAAEAGGRARFNTVQATDAAGRPVTTTADRIAGSPIVGQSPAEGAAARMSAEAAEGARQQLGGTVQQANEALGLIEAIRNNPAIGWRTGLTGQAPAIPGTPGADFDAMADQLKGKVFLEAFQSLKGAGAITEQEGKAATVAIARLNRAQSKEGYLKGLADLEQVIKAGVRRTEQKAGQGRAPTIRPDRSAIEAEMRRRGLLR